jgi:hypothetical protein
MSTLVGVAPGHVLAAAPAAAYARALAHGAPAGITSSTRSRAQQARLRYLYLTGRGAFALPPGTSKHEVGEAIDLPEPARSWARWDEFGWVRTNDDEPWHREYQITADQHLDDPDPLPPPAPAPVYLEEDLVKFVRTIDAPEGPGAIYLLCPGQPPQYLDQQEWALWVRLGAKTEGGDFLRAEVDILANTLGG